MTNKWLQSEMHMLICHNNSLGIVHPDLKLYPELHSMHSVKHNSLQNSMMYQIILLSLQMIGKDGHSFTT